MITQPQPNTKVYPPKIRGVYRAIMTQDGTTAAPIAQVVINTIGNIIWTRTAAGQYLATLTGAFPNQKTDVIFGNTNGSCIITGARSDDNTIYLDTFVSGTAQDGNLSYTPVQITTYNYNNL